MKNTSAFGARMLLLAASALSMDAALAGSKFTGNGHVQITRSDDGSGSASGYLAMIYNMTGNDEWLGCQKSSTNTVYCTAKHVDQTIVSCFATSAYLANAVSSISPDSRVTFRYNSSGRCTNITVVHSSEFEDKR